MARLRLKHLAWTGLLALGSVWGFAEWSAWNDDPDVPVALLGGLAIDKQSFMEQRAEHIARLRGVDPEWPFDPALRVQAIAELEAEMSRQPNGTALPAWRALGPAPIPNGQTVGTVTAVSGRTTAIAVHPSNPDIVYVGTANGGLYRTLDGGSNWRPLLDNALSLAIGAIAIAPSQPETVYVGTGEANFSLDSFFGVGVYRITDASSANPTISVALNLDVNNADVFTGRAISEIQVHPSDPAIIFVATASGVAGLGAQAVNPPSRGVYRSDNATAAAPTFRKLIGLAADANLSVRDIILDPLNPNFLVASIAATGVPTAGIYVSTDALALNPSFVQRVPFNSASTSEVTAEFAIQHTAGANPTVYAAVGNGGGRVLINTDGGTTWTQQIDNDFCTPQCFYDIAIDVDPNDATRVYLGGAPTLPFAFSDNSATSFTISSNGLHVDSHAIAVSRSAPDTIYFGSDGGIYRSTNRGATWTPLNNEGFSATQFQGMATHPRDRQFMIGGTQDNGTNLRRANGSWTRVDFGDGGFAAIDQNATDTTNVRMYHTYFNRTNAMGYARVTNIASASDGNWTFFGCGFAGTANGMTCTASGILFYAPTALGPGNPNTYYFGSDVLYRSADGGTTMSKVSQEPLISSQPISAIGIAPSSDNIRAVGLRNGALFRTIDGSSSLASVDPVGAGSLIPDSYISRVVIDPLNSNVAYVALSAYAGAGMSIWKTSTFLTSAPVWTPAGTGIPNIPVNALVIDPSNTLRLFAGTDIGVYRSTNGGTTWSAFSNALPRTPVFEIAYQGLGNASGGVLRIATHGRGIYELDFDRVFGFGFEGF